MRFKIIGANAESGDDVDVMLEAASQPAVEQMAHDKGILVTSITALQGNNHHDTEAIALVDDESGVDGAPAVHAPGMITMSANSPSDTAHSVTAGHTADVHVETALEYHIMVNQSMYLLETAVNRQIREGWEPQGGVGLAVANNALQYFQAVIRRKK